MAGAAGKAPGFEASDLAGIATSRALSDAGLCLADVDGLFFCHGTDTLGGLSFAQYLGIQPKITDNNRIGGSSFQAMVENAAWLLDTGMIDCALIAYGSNQASAAGKLVNTVVPHPYEAPYRPMNPLTSYALAAQRYMHEFGLTKPQLGEVAIAARKWAQLNPVAFKRDPLTIADVVGRPIISSASFSRHGAPARRRQAAPVRTEIPRGARRRSVRPRARRRRRARTAAPRTVRNLS